MSRCLRMGALAGTTAILAGSLGAARAVASDPVELAFTGVDGRLRVEPGRHRIMVGTSSVDLPMSAELEVVGEVRHLPARTRFFSTVEVS